MRLAKPGATLSRRAFHAIMLAAAGAPLLALREAVLGAAGTDGLGRSRILSRAAQLIPRISTGMRQALQSSSIADRFHREQK